MGNSVDVNFKVSGGDLSSFMDRMKAKSDDLSKTMIKNAQNEGGSAKDQLRSYEQQIAMLERKHRLQSDMSRREAEITRSSGLSEIQSDLKSRYADISARYSSPKDAKLAASLRADAKEGAQVRAEEIEERFEKDVKQIKEQHRDNQTLVRAMRENVDAVKDTSKQQLGQMRRGDDSLIDAIEDGAEPNERLANQIASEDRKKELAEKDKKKDEKRDPESVFGGFLKALAFDRVGGMVANMPSAKSELDFVKPMIAATSMAIAGLAGSAVDVLAGSKIFGTGVGQTNFGALGAQLGEKFGEFAGSAVERTYKSRDELTSANFRIQALTGSNYGIDAAGTKGAAGTGFSSIVKDLSQYGADFKETAELQFRLAQAQGTGRGLMSGAENMLAAQQGLGVQTEAFLGLTELLRSSSKGNQDVLKLIGGVATAGRSNMFAGEGGRTFLSEFLQKNFSGLQKTLLQTQNTVASGTTFDILKRFDAIGGPFSARDPRSMGLINSIHGSLVNPGSDNTKALSTIMMRRANPSMDFFELEKEKQKGLGSSAYLKSMLGSVDMMGGTESMKKMNLANLLGLGGNLDAAELLYKNREALVSGKLSMNELLPGQGYGEDSVRSLGRDQTSIYTKGSAEIENAFVKSSIEGIEIVGSKMKDLFGRMMDDLDAYVTKRVKDMVFGVTPEKTTVHTTNATKQPLTRGAYNSKTGNVQVDYSRPMGGL